MQSKSGITGVRPQSTSDLQPCTESILKVAVTGGLFFLAEVEVQTPNMSRCLGSGSMPQKHSGMSETHNVLLHNPIRQVKSSKTPVNTT